MLTRCIPVPHRKPAEREAKKAEAKAQQDMERAAKQAEKAAAKAATLKDRLAKGDASKVLGTIAPLVVAYKDAMHRKVADMEVRRSLPKVVLEDGQQVLDKLISIELAWTRVLQGDSAPSSDDLQRDAALSFAKQARALMNSIASMADAAILAMQKLSRQA